MNKGEIKLGEQTLPIADWQIEPLEMAPRRLDWSKMIGGMQGTSIEMSGTLTQHGIDTMLEMMHASAREEPIYMYISKETLWMLQYLEQGKRYPRPRTRKSKARMSKKWRTYE